MSARASAITGFVRTVSDLDATAAFYGRLGFARTGVIEPVPEPILDALGLAGTDARRLRMRIGAQAVAFHAFDPPGAPYPAEPRANDPFFQHLAIPVRDMDAAVAGLGPVAPIGIGGPVRLPASSGGVTAFKFRDPDGHPLELIHFPAGEPARRWADAPGLFLGIDHSAITVGDDARAVAFLTGLLGLAVAERGLNRGTAQGRLDGLPEPVVDVIALRPPGAGTPHVELLHYRAPRALRPSQSVSPRDRASTLFVFASPDPGAVVEAARSAGRPARLSADGAAAHLAGPDDHGMVFLRDVFLRD